MVGPWEPFSLRGVIASPSHLRQHQRFMLEQPRLKVGLFGNVGAPYGWTTRQPLEGYGSADNGQKTTVEDKSLVGAGRGHSRGGLSIATVSCEEGALPFIRLMPILLHWTDKEPVPSDDS
jgi:hypothetical protein